MTNQCAEREDRRQASLLTAALAAGYACASVGGKLKSNPNPGGSPEWWAWHKGYKAAKRIEASMKRQASLGQKR
jgi:hypothetical protein